MAQTVEHDEKNHRFLVRVEGEEAVLAYSQEGTVLNFYRTFVPEHLRGQGIAEKIVKAGFDYAREKGFRVLPTCPYISQSFLKRYEEYRTLLET